MRSYVQRVTDRLEAEGRAWLGMREALALRVISYVKPETFELHVGTSDGVTQIEPPDVVTRLLQAIQQGRSIATIFIKDDHAPEHVAYVIAIDLDRGRVDRQLSSWQLLEDPWSWRRRLLPVSVHDAPNDYRMSLMDFLHVFALVAVHPVQERYRRAFLARQQAITKMYGRSLRFTSLINCVSPQLDTQTRALFQSATHALWQHEEWMNRPVTFHEAQTALANSRVVIQEFDHNNQFWEMHDFGPEIAQWQWFDEHGDQIAHGTIYGDGANPGSGNTEVRLHVFGSVFGNETAKTLLGYYKSKS